MVVVTPKPGVKVYPNREDMIVIANFSEEHSGDEYCEHIGCSYVRIHPDDAELVAKAILATSRDIKGETPF